MFYPPPHGHTFLVHLVSILRIYVKISPGMQKNKEEKLHWVVKIIYQKTYVWTRQETVGEQDTKGGALKIEPHVWKAAHDPRVVTQPPEI